MNFMYALLALALMVFLVWAAHRVFRANKRPESDSENALEAVTRRLGRPARPHRSAPAQDQHSRLTCR